MTLDQNSNKMTVQNLSKSDREELVNMFCDAFRTYPVMRYIIGKDDVEYEIKLQNLIGFYCDIRFANNWPVLGIMEAGSLIAGMLVTKPSETITHLDELLQIVKTQLGDYAFERMKRFEEASDRNEPDGDHYFVGMLGVNQENQKKGAGKILLEYAKNLVIEAGSPGVCLSTEDPMNVPYYKYMGFVVYSESDVDELHTWCLYWKNQT